MGIHHYAKVHPKAHVDPHDVRIGAGTRVWQFATVIQGTRIGEDCIIGACATLSGPHIGDRVKISSGVVMGPGFKIEDDVFVGPNVVLANDYFPFAAGIGFDVTELRRGERFAVIIEKGASIGANSVILPGVRIGAGSLVAAGTVVDVDVPPGCVVSRAGHARPVPDNWHQRRMRWAT